MFKKIQLLILTITLSFAFTGNSYAVFSDITSNHPNFEAIEYLQENGIIDGYEDHTFRPNQTVNRVEALKIILLGSKIPVPEIQKQEIFPDVVHGTWYAKYARKAKQLNIVNGDSDTGLFRPGDTINLAEILKIIIKTNNIETSSPSNNPYWDIDKNSWFASYFHHARISGLLDQNSNQNIDPGMNVSRSMLAELMYRNATTPKGYIKGKASFYAGMFHGRTTANGETYDASEFTAAHRTMNFGTWLKVVNLENNQSTYVRINDRGPYADTDNRIIDLSKAAFETISPISRGVINVAIYPENPPKDWDPSIINTDLLSADLLSTQKCTETTELRFLEKDSFENITLDNEIPNRFIENEILTLSGIVSNSAKGINAFIVNSNDVQTGFSANITDNKFTVNIPLSNVGTYKLGIISGEFGTSIIKEIKVLPSTCIQSKSNPDIKSPSNVLLELNNGNTVIKWDKNENSLFKIVFIQGSVKKEYYLHNADYLIPNYSDFKDFKEGSVVLSMQGAKLTNKSILEPNFIEWSSVVNKNFSITTHHEYLINPEQIEIVKLPNNLKINENVEIKVKANVNLRANAAIILPDGKVDEIMMKSDTHEAVKDLNDVEIFSKSSGELNFNFTPKENKIHFLEINNSNGLAAINIPIYPENTYPLIPNPNELSERKSEDLGTNLTSLRSEMLNLINADRRKSGLPALKLDTKLSQLAQFRALDMYENKYFGHWDKDGRSANDIRKNYAITQMVAENLAKDTNLELAEYNLMRSAIHRSNILSKEWTRMGFGIVKIDDGSYYFVQIFSDDPVNLDDINTLRQTMLSAINEGRSVNLILKSNLNTVSQNWSDLMVSDDFFAFASQDGSKSLVDNVRNAGMNESLGTYIIGNSTFNGSIDQAKGNAQIKEPQWKNIGVGVSQDEFGIIKVTLVYTE